ncbi:MULTISPECIES: hypothetical protein [unclassified Acinetobacter]|uniref:hypothetical protein n=1 Tax=unclassified Acinetobacter TaxID=196816 RepID=UPI0029341813|nr:MULTISPECIES: hypothetical protein [unclassified Acinetobacter]WOE32791.1 hypothetical protein QSG84_06345 [Acinetobacter sp. SAAs470]WOE38268.1 hypothetical protein QSG86_15400 [Acinetobacter sp. SAAs474]
MSSECLMATILNGGPVSGNGWATYFHPRDPSDFKRCIGLLEAVPTFRSHLSLMKNVSKEWSVLVEHWDELEVLLKEEIPQRSAPRTYARMKELFNSVEPTHD